VAFKHLRYTFNFFEEALPESSKLLLKQISQVQDYLGTLNDHQVGVDLATQVLKKHPENLAVQQYRDERLLEMEKMAQEFPPLWKKLTGQNFRSRLAGALAHVE
jgi:CHAD domain-containing protein